MAANLSSDDQWAGADRVELERQLATLVTERGATSPSAYDGALTDGWPPGRNELAKAVCHHLVLLNYGGGKVSIAATQTSAWTPRPIVWVAVSPWRRERPTSIDASLVERLRARGYELHPWEKGVRLQA